VVETVRGGPADARRALDRLAAAKTQLDAIACNHATASWGVLRNVARQWPRYAEARVVFPASYHWPNFLMRDNLLNVANQIAVIAVIAIGMTMVIITAGIDLSVGSLIALSAVTSALLVRDIAGAEAAGAPAVALCCLAAILLCACVGAFTGTIVTAFRVPPFIVTLAVMLIARGLAMMLSGAQSIYKVSDAYAWLGQGKVAWNIPNSVLLMAVLYIVAHIVMSRTVLGRYIYAIGGNPEAARLAGVPVKRVVVLVYAATGALAGLGGIILASKLKSGVPTYGLTYELKVIAAVVVGGTSLMGGQGKIFGTLIGAFIIAVIENGMNLMGVPPHPQPIVLGLVILGAVLLDTLKKKGMLAFRKSA